MEVFGLGLQVECIVMMERPSRTLEVQPVSNNVYYPYLLLSYVYWFVETRTKAKGKS